MADLTESKLRKTETKETVSEDLVIPNSITAYHGEYGGRGIGANSNVGKHVKYNDANDIMPMGGLTTLEGNTALPDISGDDLSAVDKVAGNSAGTTKIGCYKNGAYLIVDIAGVANANIGRPVWLMDNDVDNLILVGPYAVEAGTIPAKGDPVGVLEQRLDSSTLCLVRLFDADLMYALTICGTTEVENLGSFPLAIISAANALFTAHKVYDSKRLQNLSFRVESAVTTAAKASDIMPYNGATVLSTDGIELTSALCIKGAEIDVTDLELNTASRIFHSGDVLNLHTAASTAFIEGQGHFRAIWQKLFGN